MATETERGSYGGSSTLVGVVRRVVQQFQTWLAASLLARTGEVLTSGLTTAVDASAVAGSGRAVARWTRRSFLYRWLTAEPDPEVIVIDLRETYTVGPVIALLDRVAPIVARTWRGSHAARVTARLRTATNQPWLTDSRTVRLLTAALEPPDPPDEERRD